MSKILILVALTAAIPGCASARSSTWSPTADALASAGIPELFQADRLGEISTGRFCRIRMIEPNAIEMGIVESTSPDEIVLVDVTVISPRTMGLFGNLPLDWPRRDSRGSDIIFRDRISVQRGAIDLVEVYDEGATARLREEYAQWRAQQRCVREELLTAQEFPSSG